MIYRDIELKIEFDLTENEYLIVKDGRYNVIEKDAFPLIELLPLLQIDVCHFKLAVEKGGLAFYEVIPLENLFLTAFDEGFSTSIYWKELALAWIKNLNYCSPMIITLLENKSSKESNLPKDFKFKIKKVVRALRGD